MHLVKRLMVLLPYLKAKKESDLLRGALPRLNLICKLLKNKSVNYLFKNLIK